MPEKNPLSKEQLDKFLAHLNQKWPDKVCSVCKQSNWNLIDTPVQIFPLLEKTLIRFSYYNLIAL